MVDAFTFTNGSEMRTFRSREELYDYMVERGEIVVEGDDAPIFKKHVDKRAAQAGHRVNEKAVAAKARLEN